MTSLKTTKRWGGDSGWPPRIGSKERAEDVKKHPGCYLDVHDMKFPVCDSNGQINPKGVEAALERAREYDYTEVAQKAAALLEKIHSGQSKAPSSRAKGKKKKPRSKRKRDSKGRFTR